MRTQTTNRHPHMLGVLLFAKQPRTGNLISKYTSTVNGTVANEYTYTYDANGNITKITYADGKTITYTYDDRGQLLTEVNEVIGRSYTYTYDKAGNRTYTKEVKLETSVTVNELNHTYQTDGAWGDALSIWRGEGWGYHTVDEIGNLTGIVTPRPVVQLDRSTAHRRLRPAELGILHLQRPRSAYHQDVRRYHNGIHLRR